MCASVRVHARVCECVGTFRDLTPLFHLADNDVFDGGDDRGSYDYGRSGNGDDDDDDDPHAHRPREVPSVR